MFRPTAQEVLQSDGGGDERSRWRLLLLVSTVSPGSEERPLSSSRLASAERGIGGTTVLIHRRSPRSHLTRYSSGEAARSQSQCWVFPNLYNLLVFARAEGFAEVDAQATDWRTVSGSA